MAKCYFCDVTLIQGEKPKHDGYYVEHRCPDCDNRYIFAEHHAYIIPPGQPVEGQIWAMEQSYKQGMMAKRGGSGDSTGQAKKDTKRKNIYYET